MAKLKVMNSTIGRKAGHRRTNADAGKAVFGDRRVDDPARAEFIEQTLRDLVGALVFGDFLAHDEDIVSRRISSAMASRRASRTVVETISVPAGISGSRSDFGLRRGRNGTSRLLRRSFLLRRFFDLGRRFGSFRRANSIGAFAVLQQNGDRWC